MKALIKRGRFRVFQYFFTILMLVCFAVILFRSAWLCDDAFITYRTVHNFVNGYGLTWNTVERVQAYTHPLWMFLNAGLYFLTREIYFTFMCTPIIISIIAVILYAFFIAGSPLSASIGVAILLFSKAFIDFSSSGLENPLTHLLLVIFFMIYFRGKPGGRRLLLLSLVAAFATINRMDTILLYIPAIIYVSSKFRPFKKGIYLIAAGFTSFFLWELFSLFYYGFPFPNTAYAKLNTGISATLMLQHGFRYLFKCFTFDPITLTAILFSLTIPFVNKRKSYLPLGLGIILYLALIVRIGGDFMVGRYLTAPLLLAVILITRSYCKYFTKKWLVLSLFVLLFAFMTPYPTILTNEHYGWNKNLKNIGNKVTDSRGLFYKYNGLLRYTKGRIPKPYENMSFLKHKTFKTAHGIGNVGFCSGPHAFILDTLALSDPLLARLPAKNKLRFWIGHIPRMIPGGYILTLKTGQNRIKNRNVAEFYDQITLITRGDLLDKDRLVAIWNMNTGRYDHLIENIFIPPRLHCIPRIIAKTGILKSVEGKSCE